MEYVPLLEDPLGNLGILIIPSLILGTALSAATMRMTRTMMLEVLRQDYIRTAWSKGLRERVVVITHAVKNALIPVVTLVGLQFLPGRSGVAIKGVLVESDRVVAGLYGEMFWGKMHTRLLWVHPDRRQGELGRRMMTWAEQRSRELGCRAVTVETMSFQAPGFYAPLG